MWNRWGNNGNSDRLYFGGLQNHCRWWLQPWNKKTLIPWKESYDQPRQHIKKQKHYFANKGLSSQGFGFASGHVWMWELDYKESWALKNWCFWTVVLEKTLESPLGCKEIQPVHPRRNQSWVFIGRTHAEAQTPTLWSPDVKSWLIGKDPDAGKDWKQEEKGKTEDEMVGWHHLFDGHELEQTLGYREACSSWGCKESDMIEQLKNSKFLAVLVFTVRSRLSLVVVSRGCSLATVCGPLIADFSCCGAQALSHVGSVVLEHRLSCPVACEIIRDQGSNLCPPHWHADYQPLDHQGSPLWGFKKSSSCMAIV